eukprot:scaffold3946_cov177-Amphora_coffeaeformis.AAC.13
MLLLLPYFTSSASERGGKLYYCVFASEKVHDLFTCKDPNAWEWHAENAGPRTIPCIVLKDMAR